ncbi:L-type lectin-domain containing receptor kinase IX.1-like [Camellia sinensis]|uniref:L-type lectin-domain containing receptor kinase IX.1-like n=1 Tax=Camellia sinensis TaxID=4442 RepID=UPI00103625D5|nr:L-type lectin-domain containing receptor kinase IX.1-like [Camellia sinensis]
MTAAANGPQLFPYKKLSKATRNFGKDNLLGTGGFGSVYKWVMSKPPTSIAVKKINATSKQGEKEYLAEIYTISRLRHKNLLRLQGSCYDHDQLLLVYEYMPNGSLDCFIGKDNTFLDWATRYKVLLGLASTLVYLHEECGNPVVHRDAKPNTVMLDSQYNAHIGDFGLARLLQNEASVTTRIAGTLGYLAPEVSFTGRATPESNVYSFGMVVLEVVCGKRSKGIMDENSIVDSVWTLYEKGVDALLDCVDRLLEGKFDEEEVKRSLVVAKSMVEVLWRLCQMRPQSNMGRVMYKRMPRRGSENFPPSKREELRKQFVELRQGITPLVQFEAWFANLSRFAPELVETEELRCSEFESKLCDDIRERIVGSWQRSYSVLVKAAAHVEAAVLAMGQSREEAILATPVTRGVSRPLKRQRGFDPQQFQREQSRSTFLVLSSSLGQGK